MNDEPFEARNSLEQDLVAAQEGRLASDVFMERLMDAQVFMPVRDSINRLGIQISTQADPLRIKREDGVEVLVLFTSPERAKPFVANYAGFSGGLLAEWRWVIERVGVGIGIALNPGWSVGFDLDPEDVASLIPNSCHN